MYRVTSTYFFPFKEDVCRFDFEVRPEDEYMCNFIEKSFAGGECSSQEEMDVGSLGRQKL